MNNQQPKIFISHTTVDKRDYSLAHNIGRALEERGAKVWIAPGSIPTGSKWKEGIVSGVMNECTCFLVILSAASIQSKWVLEEIKLARKRVGTDPNFRLVPLQVGILDDYKNIDFIKQHQQVAYHEGFNDQLEAIAKALNLRPAVPDNISNLIIEKTAGFVGRQYVFDAVESFLKDNPQGYFIIAGDPGIGKSAILARIVQQQGCIAHFNIRAQGINTARQFLESICTQLIVRYSLGYATLPPEATQSSAFLVKLLNEAALQLADSGRLVIAVDALDEVEPTNQSNNILFLPATLPDKVYFILTRRHTPITFTVHTPQKIFDLMQYQNEGMLDVLEFITAQCKVRNKLKEWITLNNIDAEALVVKLGALSKGNFMYVRYVLPDIEKGVYDTLNIDHLPIGLEGYYEDHWRRMGMTVKPLPRVKIRIVYVLSEARLPVSRQLITHIASDNTLPLDEVMVQEVLDEWDEFLHEQKKEGVTMYSVYHASFQDFLHRQDIVQAAGVTLKEINKVIADNMWENLFGAAPSS